MILLIGDGWVSFFFHNRKKNEDSQPQQPQQQRYLELADDGGNELPVSAVEYQEISELIVNIVEVTDNVDDHTTSSGRDDKSKSNNKSMSERRITVAAMNVEGIPKEEGRCTLQERVVALQNDR